MPKRFARGFTLIELLVVISIIGVLAALTLASYGNAQSKARDGIRKSDLAQVKRAMELAKSDCSGASFYPYISTSGSLAQGQDNYLNGTETAGLAIYVSDPSLNYISSVVKDPTNTAVALKEYKYAYFTNASTANKCPDISGGFTRGGSSDFVIAVQLERATDQGAVESRKKCPASKPGSTYWNVASFYVVCNN